MAADIYLHIEGIKGESTDDGHRGWLECLAVDMGGVHQPACPVAGSNGRTVARCHHDTIVITRLSDLATPILLQTCCMGKTLARARIEFMRADGAQPIAYYVVELEHVLVAEVAPEVSEGQTMGEYLVLAYGKIKWTYARQQIGGGVAGRTVGGWDLTSNTRLA